MNAILFEVLAVLREGPCDATDILARLRRLGGSGSEPSIPALYRYLRRGMERGWISAEEADAGGPGDDTPGRPPRSYRLSVEGEQAARAEARRLSRFTGLVLEPDNPDGG